MFKYGNGDYMLKNLKKYSLFLVLTVFINILGMHNVKAEIGNLVGGGGGSYLEPGTGPLINLTNPSAISDMSNGNLDNNPAIRVTVVDKNGNVVSGTNIVDVITWDWDYNSKKLFIWNRLKTAGNTFDGKTVIDRKTYYISKDQLGGENACHSFISNCEPTLSEDFYDLLKDNQTLQDDFLSKLNTTVNPDYYLVLEPILLYCIDPGDGTSNYSCYYGTANQYYKDHFNSVWGTNGKNAQTYTRSLNFFTITASQITGNKLNMNNAAVNNIESNYGNKVNIISLKDFGKTYQKYSVEDYTANLGTCNSSDKTVTLGTKSYKNGTANNIEDYNKKYGKRFVTTPQKKCALYCIEKVTINLPGNPTPNVSLYKTTSDKFNWITESRKLSVKYVLNCRLLPYLDNKDISSISNDDYKTCMNYSDENVKKLIKNNVKINIPTVKFTYEDGSNKIASSNVVTTTNSSITNDDIDITASSCDTNCENKTRKSRIIKITKTYNYSGASITPVLPESPGNYSYNMYFTISGVSTNKTTYSTTDKYTCTYGVKVPYCEYNASLTSANPAYCTLDNINKSGIYTIGKEKDMTTCSDEDSLEKRNQRNYGINIASKRVEGVTCSLYCTGEIKTEMPNSLSNNGLKTLDSKFQWINKNSLDMYKLKVKTKLTCKFALSSGIETSANINKCTNYATPENITNILNQEDCTFSAVAGFNCTSKNVSTTSDIDFVYEYQKDSKTKENVTFDLKKESVSNVTVDANKTITIEFNDEFKMDEEPVLYSDKLDGKLLVLPSINDNISDYNKNGSKYDKVEQEWLHIPKISIIDQKYNLQLKINSLGINSGDMNFNDVTVLNKTTQSDYYTCDYTPVINADCQCPQGTDHQFESPYDYMDESDKQNYTCAEAIQQFCDVNTEKKPKTCIRQSDGKEIELETCLGDNNTLEYCKNKECNQTGNKYTCEYTKDGNKLQKDISSCVTGIKNSGKSEEAAIEYCTNKDSDCCKTKGTCPEDNIVYRTIDLNNPFPGKDGDGRTPGSNWNSTTLIENKITKTTNAYNETPIYKITLTPSTIKEIREYNDNHDYLDYENLNCNEAGVACISSFLHGTSTGTNTTSAIVEVSGDCKNVTHNNFYTCLHYDDGTNDVY